MPSQPITTVEQLVARFESSALDYKTTYDLAKPGVRYDIAKDVAAFASAFGGTIVVGVVEGGGRAAQLEGVSDVAKLLSEVATSLRLHCVPIPSTPDEYAIVVTPEDAGRFLPSGTSRPSSPVTVVTLNVRPDPRGPIGVRPFARGKEPQGAADAYKFPVRVDDQTRFMDPTELPMWMNSHERRVAINLNRALEEAGGSAKVRVYHLLEGRDLTQPVSMLMRLSRVDEDAMVVGFSESLETNGGPVDVPLTFVSAVWRDAGGNHGWCMSVRGLLYPRTENGVSVRFRPLGGA